MCLADFTQINDLLEYSRLNHSTRKRKMTESKKVANHDDASDGESGVMIDALTEDAVDAACLGFEQQSVQRNGSSMANDEHATILTLNIEEAQSLHWLSDVGGGAWKRICLNLVTNALKYTHSGYISVTLRKKWLQHSAKKKSARVELVVSSPAGIKSRECRALTMSRSKTLASVCRTSSKPNDCSSLFSKRVAWLLAQDS